MREVADILFGAAFTVAVSVALGALLIARLRLTFYRWEAALIEFVAGAGCLSFLIAILCVLHVARKGVFQWGGVCDHCAGPLARQGRHPAQSLAGSLSEMDGVFYCYI